MTCKNQFDYGFDEKPSWKRQAEEAEIIRLKRREESRTQIGNLMAHLVSRQTPAAAELRQLLGM